MHKPLIQFIQKIYQTTDFIPLHEPTFSGNEKAYVADAIDSTYVSSTGYYVDKFEDDLKGVAMGFGVVFESISRVVSNNLSDLPELPDIITAYKKNCSDSKREDTCTCSLFF